MEIKLTKKNFDEEVLDSDKPVLVDFYARWCPPCRAMMPVVEQLSEEYDGRVKVGTVNTGKERRLAMKYGVMSIPTFLIFKNGKVVDSLMGAMPKKDLANRLEAQL